MQTFLTLHNGVLLPYYNVLMSVGHLDHVLLTVYSSMEHLTWKSPGRICGWVGRILCPNSCMSGSSWSKMPLWSIWSVAVPLCRPLLPCPSRWHGSLPWHGLWWLTCELHCSPLLCRLRSQHSLLHFRVVVFVVVVKCKEGARIRPWCGRHYWVDWRERSAVVIRRLRTWPCHSPGTHCQARRLWGTHLQTECVVSYILLLYQPVVG